MLQIQLRDSMLEAPKRPQRLSVALPASLTQDVPHLREKTGKIGLIARALAIFRVEEVAIYDDKRTKAAEAEGRLLEKLLIYQETPQYLRRTLFMRDPDLQFAGTLPPLRTPNHPDLADPKMGQLREALVVESGNPSKVNAGFRTPAEVPLKLKRLDRVTVRLTCTSPRLEAELVDPSGLAIYWGFRVTRGNLTLAELIRSRKQDLTISTSRRGRIILDVMGDVTVRWKSSKRPLLLFGSPEEGVPDILAREGVKVAEAVDFNLNMIPNQGVGTVRTEEAVLATLSGLNLLEET